MAYLSAKNICKSFDGVQVLKNVSVDVEKNEVICLLGPSGNGKTTFLRCLVDLYTPESGTIELNGKAIFPLENKKDKPSIGMVFQNYNLFPQYNSIENITLALNIKDINEAKNGLKQQDKTDDKKKKRLTRQDIKNIKEKNKQIALNLLKQMQIEDKAYNYPFELSGGQKQRLAIARALALKPELLLFDEPTSALDPRTTKAVGTIVKSLKKENTIIIVTHDLDFAKLVADRIYFICKGKIELSGTVEEMFKSKNPVWLEFLGEEEKKVNVL